MQHPPLRKSWRREAQEERERWCKIDHQGLGCEEPFLKMLTIENQRHTAVVRIACNVSQASNLGHKERTRYDHDVAASPRVVPINDLLTQQSRSRRPLTISDFIAT